ARIRSTTACTRTSESISLFGDTLCRPFSLLRLCRKRSDLDRLEGIFSGLFAYDLDAISCVEFEACRHDGYILACHCPELEISIAQSEAVVRVFLFDVARKK